MSYVVQTNSLAKIIDGKEIVQNVNLHVKEIYGFLGPNSAGKTTVIKMLTNLWKKPTSGSIEIFEILTPQSCEILKE